MNMKQVFTLMFGFLLLFTNNIFSQAIDTVEVPTVVDGSPFGAINKFIMGDTTASGDRANPNRYYRLKNDAIYFLDGILFADFDLRLIGEEFVAGKKPPIVASTAGSDGTIQLIQFKLFGNAYIKNIICQMTPPSGIGESNAAFFLSGQGKSYEFDNVYIEWGLWTGMVTEVPVKKITVRNCYFRNPQHKTDIWNGRGIGFYQQNPADSVIIQNNTFFNMNSFAFFADVSSIPPRYLLFDHNTIVNSMKFPIHSFWLPNATVTNNIFYNAHSYGENDQDKVGQDPQRLLYGIINIDKIPNALKTYYSIKEENRIYKVSNNAFFYSDEIKNYWTSFSLAENPFMNGRNEGFFSDNTSYPSLSIENTIKEDPIFIDKGNAVPAMVQWMTNRRNLVGNDYWGWDPDNSKFQVQWPFPENLAYANNGMKTAASGGFPLGDLNWWKDQKTAWESWYATSTSDQRDQNISDITLMPNPTNDKVVISLEMTSSAKVNIRIFDISLRQFGSIHTSQLAIGHHKLELDLPALGITNQGMYYVTLMSGNQVITRKLVKL